MGLDIEIEALYKEINIQKIIEFIKKSKFTKLKGDIIFKGEKNGKPITSLKDVGLKKVELEDNHKDYLKIGPFYFKVYTASWAFGKYPENLKDEEIKIKEDYEDLYIDGCWITIENWDGLYGLRSFFDPYLFQRDQWTEFFRNREEDVKYAIANSSNLVNFAIELIKETKPLKLIIDYEGEGIDKDEQPRSWFSYSKKLKDFSVMAKACQKMKGQSYELEGSLSKVLQRCVYKTFELNEGFAVQISPTIDMLNDPEYKNFYDLLYDKGSSVQIGPTIKMDITIFVPGMPKDERRE